VSPPSGAGRRRGTGVPLDSPVACASSPATHCTNRGGFGGRERHLEVTPASRRRAPHATGLSGMPAAASRSRTIKTVGSSTSGCDLFGAYPFDAVHRGPVHRVHGAVHRACTRPRPLDLRSTVWLRRFL
jgi:hypothetical protein